MAPSLSPALSRRGAAAMNLIFGAGGATLTYGCPANLHRGRCKVRPACIHSDMEHLGLELHTLLPAV